MSYLFSYPYYYFEITPVHLHHAPIIRVFRQIKKELAKQALFMPVTGLEPVRGCPRGILSPLRLPIPPHRQTYKYVDDGSPSNGTYRARTYDPLLVRQMLSQLS